MHRVPVLVVVPRVVTRFDEVVIREIATIDIFEKIFQS
jgi:hypothetical protein